MTVANALMVGRARGAMAFCLQKVGILMLPNIVYTGAACNKYYINHATDERRYRVAGGVR